MKDNDKRVDEVEKQSVLAGRASLSLFIMKQHELTHVNRIIKQGSLYKRGWPPIRLSYAVSYTHLTLPTKA